MFVFAPLSDIRCSLFAVTFCGLSAVIQYGRQHQTETDLLFVLLCDLIAKKSINEAENLLFDWLDQDNSDHFMIATDFYRRLNGFTDEELVDADFSREEIVSGLNEVNAIFGL